jgi:hypothetical protein
MRHQVWIGTLIVALIGAAGGLRAEPLGGDPQPCFLKRLGPAGGWNPDGGGLLHWWNPHCFPRSGAPDDYCRKPLPGVCWPAYPAWYKWGPPENGGRQIILSFDGSGYPEISYRPSKTPP